MKIKSKLAMSILGITLVTLMCTGCKPSNEIDIIDDQGNIVDKPKDYDKLPKGLEEIKPKENKEDGPKKSNLKIQDLEELREPSTGFVPLDKANQWLTEKMKDYKEIERKYNEETGVTSVYYVKADGTGKEQEVRILHPYKPDGITPIQDQVLQIFIGEKELNTLDMTNDESGL